MRIAIIGAGVAGLACARRLAERGHAVRLFDDGDEPGGRVATLKTELGGFDTGAQYFTARDPAFAAEVHDWSGAGIVEPWAAVPASLAGHRAVRVDDRRGIVTLRWVGVPGMVTLARHLAEGLDLQRASRVAHVQRAGDAWRLDIVDAPIANATEATYDAVIVAVPAAAAVSLLAEAPALAVRASKARIAPCWALFAAFEESIDAVLDQGSAAFGDCAFVEAGRLAWIARESSKPERRPGERWTLHAQSGWSAEHFNDDPEDVKTKLVSAFRDATGTHEQPIRLLVRRWREALVTTPLDGSVLWDAATRIGACGDWCRGHRVEDAWLAGVALADTIGDAG